MNIVIFDGVCNLCNNVILTLIKYDKNNQLYFTASQSKAGLQILNKYAIPHNTSSVIFIKNEQIFTSSDAILEIVKLIKGWPRVLLIGKMIPKKRRDVIYNWIAKYRYTLFGKKDYCSIPDTSMEHKFIN